MKLKNIFTKALDRQIDGVIKADDDSSLKAEVEEYVMTGAVERPLDTVLEAYNKTPNANGVWISGFFGSGKSHLLKMLSLLLEDREIDGISVRESFLDKSESATLKGQMKIAPNSNSKSILFNIDQKANAISKDSSDALLGVFVKVFDEMCGYYGKQGYIAEFERQLDEKGLFEKFKASFEKHASESWESGREVAAMNGDNIAKAYSEASGSGLDEGKGILDKYRQDYKVSILDFVKTVKRYINKQPEGFRLNFFVDEVGQYIVNNVRLMTNLQTIAETLATECNLKEECKGKAFIFVTAQDDMESVIGQMQQGNDFTKIQARFINRIKLTSSNVSEVIQKRLLEKTDDASKALGEIYAKQENNFETIFGLTDDTRKYSAIKEKEDFIRSYPFIPYQYDLFQHATQGLSKHDAFEGKHQSVGERSMLAVFQDVAKSIGDMELGELASFDRMYEGIRYHLKGNAQQAIDSAEKNLGDPFAVKLLKALFLVKYASGFKSNARNIQVLFQNAFDIDQVALKKKIEDALLLLERQTYIQRNGTLYEFLTDDEKHIEKEILSTEVYKTDELDQFQSLIFEGVIRDRKIRHEETKRDFEFAKKVDDKIYGKEKSLNINIASPLNENAGNIDILASQSLGRKELMVVIEPDPRFISDLWLYKKTEKYIRQVNLSGLSATVKTIVESKASQNRDRLRELEQRANELCGKAQLCVQGDRLDIGGEDGKTRIVKGFQELVTKAYPNLAMLGGAKFSEGDIGTILQESHIGSTVKDLSESEQEVLSVIQAKSQIGERSTFDSVVRHFEGNTFGWGLAAIQCTVAKLFIKGKIEGRIDSNLLDTKAFEAGLKNSQKHSNLIIDPQVEFPPAQVTAVKKLFGDIFDQPASQSEPKLLGNQFLAELKNLQARAEGLLASKNEFPFLAVLEGPVSLLGGICNKPYNYIFTDLDKFKGDLFSAKEEIFDKIFPFMSGAQKTTFEAAQEFLKTQKGNFSYLDTSLVEKALGIVGDTDCYKNNAMVELKSTISDLEKNLEGKLAEIRKSRVDEAVLFEDRLKKMDGFSALEKPEQESLLARFGSFKSSISNMDLIPSLEVRARQFREEDFPAILSEFSKLSQKAVPGGSVTEYVHLSSIRVPVAGPLTDAASVEMYIESLRVELMKAIEANKHINL